MPNHNQATASATQPRADASEGEAGVERMIAALRDTGLSERDCVAFALALNTAYWLGKHDGLVAANARVAL